MNVLRSLRYILPAYFANSSAVLRGKYFGRTRMDFGKTFLGKPIFGSHKTREGFLGASLTAYIIAYMQRILLKRPEPIIGFLLGLGAMTGDAFGSFLKRRIGIKPGGAFPIADQLLFLRFAIAFAYPFYKISLERFLFLSIFTPALHLAFNLLAYYLGLKDVRR